MAEQLNAKELARIAQQRFSSASGDDYPAGADGYPDGASGDILEASGGLLEASGKDGLGDFPLFKMKIKAHADNGGTVFLLPGLKDTLTGLVADGTFKESTDTHDFTGEGDPATLQEFINQMKFEPTEISAIQILVNNAANAGVQMGNSLRVYYQDALRPDGQDDSKTYDPSRGQDQYGQRNDIVVIKTPGLTLSRKTKVQYKVEAGVTVTISFYVGKRSAVINTVRNAAAGKVPARLRPGGLANRGK